MRNKHDKPTVKVFMPTLAVILCLVLDVSVASAKPLDSKPISPLVVKMPISDGWELSIISNGEKTTSMVIYETSGLLNTTRATISINDCEKFADTMKATADAVQGGRQIATKQFGDVLIGIGSNPEGIKLVTLSGVGTGMLFASPLNQTFTPDEARKFAIALRVVPGINARLMSSIDFGAIWKIK